MRGSHGQGSRGGASFPITDVSLPEPVLRPLRLVPDPALSIAGSVNNQCPALGMPHGAEVPSWPPTPDGQ